MPVTGKNLQEDAQWKTKQVNVQAIAINAPLFAGQHRVISMKNQSPYAHLKRSKQDAGFN